MPIKRGRVRGVERSHRRNRRSISRREALDLYLFLKRKYGYHGPRVVRMAQLGSGRLVRTGRPLKIKVLYDNLKS